MRRAFALLAASALLQTAPTMAESPVVIDLAAKPAPFSAEQYSQLVKCTLEKHPDETRRYAVYHFTRRMSQAPSENKADPDSKLLIPIIKSCQKLELGKPIPFSLDALVSDWGKAHKLPAASMEEKRISTTDELAACAVKYNPDVVAKVLEEPRPFGAMQNMNKLLRWQCSPANGAKFDIDQLYSKLEELTAAKAVTEAGE